ncbi:M28 family peptidase [Flammeovirga sp. EKP202]|uniref:M28 family peptidase n=1 Tax=Flammeovirga sp. EKP202 TaxID=2770592 RepID=UPI00165F8261|nr:M28 family peptidase [Flammeovirga sp. EKP202]MBD0404904.1 M28 family peptidase [Flammeovirga sp. EKP202]
MNFKLNIIANLLALFSPCFLFAQNVTLSTTASEMNSVLGYLSKDALEKHTKVLASDDMKGRNMLEGGHELAAAYIKSFYNLNNIPKYNEERTLQFPTFVPQYTKFKVYNQNAILTKDHFDLFPFNSVDLNGDIEILYVDKIDFKNLYRRYTRDKGVIFHHYDPFDKMNTVKIEDINAKVFFSIKDNEHNLNRNDFRSISKRLPIAYLRKSEYEKWIAKNDDSSSEWVGVNWNTILSLFSEEQQEMISRYNMLKKKEQRQLKTEIHIESKYEVLEYENEHILGFIEGTDLKDEIILVNANYDGVGIQKGVIYNGANANATATAAVMELALAFQKAKEAGYSPRRSILFVNFTVNEIFAIGEFFFCEYSGLPIDNIVANITFKQLGRKHKEVDDENYCYLLGTQLHSSKYEKIILETANTYEKDLKIYTKTSSSTYYDNNRVSNALVFRNIPTTVLTDYCQEDLYAPTDDVDRVNFDLVYKRTKLGMKLIWEMANRSDTLEKDLFVPNKHYPEYYW